ncbi:hypothetical protein [Parafrankia sp. FMc2]|uniref:hypothetical protein n=1 Tax=Parafrankia sp. FMc2 TaxID=3233196 RepID=UPI0034D4D045
MSSTPRYAVVDSQWDGPTRQALTIPAGLDRDQILGVLVDKVAPDGRLIGVEALGGGVMLRFRWEHGAEPAE